MPEVLSSTNTVKESGQDGESVSPGSPPFVDKETSQTNPSSDLVTKLREAQGETEANGETETTSKGGSTYECTVDDSSAYKTLVHILSSFAVANGSVDIDVVQQELQDSLNALQERYARHAAFAASIEDVLTSEFQSLRPADDNDEEQQLIKELRNLQTNRNKLLSEQTELELLEARASEFEESCWRTHATGQERHQESAEILDSLYTRTKMVKGRRLALMQTNVLNDAFCIWYDGDFGVISGLRLGRLPEIPVAWSEINAAWGQVALLLATLACEVHFSFSKYRVIPMGSTSKLAKVGNERTSYELFCNGGFFRGSFNNAMVCILSCVQELGEYAEKTDRTMCLPYTIQGDKVGGLSIRTSSSEDLWTRALKNFLANLKWLLAWSSKRVRAPHRSQ